MKGTIGSLASFVILLLVMEVALHSIYSLRASTVERIPLPYMNGDQYGAVPPWWDTFRILEPDETLMWKGRPNVDRTYMDVFSPIATEEDRKALFRSFRVSLPDSLSNNPVWKISLNSEGFRDQEFPSKPPGTFRILCLGDSWTFGANVGQEESYPRQLEHLLREAFPKARFEVLNLGVLGYSSFQGLRLLKTRGLDLNPDLLVVGYAMNDSSMPGWQDKDLPIFAKTQSWFGAASNWAERHMETYKLLWYFVQLLKEKPKTLTDVLQGMATVPPGWHGSERSMTDPAEYAKLQALTRIPLPDYEQNLTDMIEMAQDRGFGVILLHNELWEQSPYKAILAKVAQTRRVPLVDSTALIAQARREIEHRLEQALGVRHNSESEGAGNEAASVSPMEATTDTSAREVEVVFRVYAGDQSVKTALYIAGVHPKLGNALPNMVQLYDDGTHGDEKPHDKVWSLVTTFLPGTKLQYVYTNSGQPGQWEGLDVPHIREFEVDFSYAGKTIYRPVETFGTIYMLADSWHTNAAGYELIAKALLTVLKSDPRVASHLASNAVVTEPLVGLGRKTTSMR